MIKFGIGKFPIFKVSAGLVGLGTTYAVVSDPTVPVRVKRSYEFWKRLFPIYMHYRYLQWKMDGWEDQKRSDAYAELHEEYAPKVLDAILHLRGFYIKAGQVMVSREDILPKRYRDELKILLDSVPALPGEEVRVVIEKAMGKPVDEIFDGFEDEAYGAASIGQVHRAKWKLTGEDVIIKVKYPDSYDLLKADVKTMKQFAELAQPEQVIIMDELERQFLKEFDFNSEGQALERVRNNLKKDFPNVVVPKPIFFNEDIVVMEFLPGVKLIDAVMDQYKVVAQRMGITLDELFERGKKMPKPTSFDKTLQRSMYMAHGVYRHTTLAAHYSTAAIYNSTLGWVFPTMSYPKVTPPPINPPALFEELLQVHAHQIFVNGFFNGDPHPGNILLLNDGRLGLIDFGQVKELTDEHRLILAQFMLAVKKDDPKEIVQKMRELGFETEKNDPEVAYLTAKVAFDKDDEKALGGLNVQQYMEALDKRDHTTKIPQHYVMAVRVCILLRGIGTLLKQPPISIAETWAPYAKRCIDTMPEEVKQKVNN